MNKLTKITILFLIVLLPFTLLLSQDGKYRSPKSFGSEREFIEYRMSSISDVSITTSSNEIFAGKIFTMTDSSLAVCIFYSCYDWRTQPVLSFDYSEINKLIVMNKGQVPKGAKKGFLIGTAVGVAIVAFLVVTEDGGVPGLATAGAIVAFSGIIFGIPGAIIGGIAGANTVKEEHYQINGNLDLFRNLHKMIGNEAIFFELPKNILIQD